MWTLLLCGTLSKEGFVAPWFRLSLKGKGGGGTGECAYACGKNPFHRVDNYGELESTAK